MNTEYLKELKHGYLDENNVTKLDFILKYPQQLAKELGEASPKLSTKQARSFFDAFNKIYLSVIGKKATLAEAKVDLAMLSSKANDKFNKGAIPKDFKDFIDNNVAAIQTDKDLKSFILHFESLCNYLKDTKTQQNNGKSDNRNSGNNTGNNNRSNNRNYDNRRR